MGFNRGEIRVKATNISVMNRKGGKSILGCWVMSGTITTTVSAHSHLESGMRPDILKEAVETYGW